MVDYKIYAFLFKNTWKVEVLKLHDIYTRLLKKY